MTGFNSYINGLDLSALNEYCVNHGRLTQYAKGDYFIKAGEESRFIGLVECGYFNYMEALRKKAYKSGRQITVTDICPGLVDTAMAKGEGLFWVMPVEKVANQIIVAIRKKKSKPMLPSIGTY